MPELAAPATYLSDCRPSFHPPCAGDLCRAVPAVNTEHNNEQVMELFGRHRDLISLPVVENGQPIGLINRNIFLSQMSRPFHREIYDRKSCIAFMDKEPLVVEADLPIEPLTQRAVSHGEKALSDGFIITREGQFLGVGHGLPLMRVVAQMQESRHRQIMHSIEYASVIQRSMLRTSREALARTGLDADLVWEPRDVVGGDFYQFSDTAEGWLATVADCTGHGVPGAFMTLIASISLSQAIQQHGPRDPAHLLGGLNRSIKQMLGQLDGQDQTAASDDGLDAACFWFERSRRSLRFAGAKTSLFVLHPGQAGVEMVDGERQGVGYVSTPIDHVWHNREVPLQSGSLVFVATDGLIDQIGGPKAIAFGKRRVRELLLAQRERSAAEINRAMQAALHEWQGSQHHRRDDLTFFCFRVQESV